MVVGSLRILAAVCASGATAYRLDHIMMQRAAAQAKAQTLVAERLLDTILVSGVSRLGVSDAPKDMHLDDLIKSVLDLPATEPFWSEVMAKVKGMAAGMASSQPLIQNCLKKEYDKFSDTVCYHLPHDMRMLKEQGTNTSRPVTAYFCGNPNIDWSGDEFQGKPQNDLCNAKVGTAYEPGGACARYSDKEMIVNMINMAKGGDPSAEGGDPRKINPSLSDCIMGLQDCNIYMCHHCPGRCSN